MAFMGIFMMALTVILIILGVSAFVTAVCFISSGIVMIVKRKKNKDGEKVKAPWYVVLLRVIGSIAAIPMVVAVGLVIYAIINDAVDKRTNLARAAASYNYEQVESILKGGADPNIRDANGKTIMMCLTDHSSFRSEDPDMSYDFNVYNQDKSDDKDLKMIKLLIEYGADINAEVTDCGIEEDHTYSPGGWTDVYANSDHPCGNTALIYAVRYRSPEFVEFLIDNGAGVNKANACGFTPILMCADCRYDDDGGFEVASLLIEEGADVDVSTNFHQNITWLLDRQNTDENKEIRQLIISKLPYEQVYPVFDQ